VASLKVRAQRAEGQGQGRQLFRGDGPAEDLLDRCRVLDEADEALDRAALFLRQRVRG
jgi:hypothetical protein